MSKLETVLRGVACLDLVFNFIQVITGIYGLVLVTRGISIPESKNNPEVKVLVNFMAVIAIKLLYLTLLFILSEILLTLFLLRAVYLKNLEHMQIWLIIAAVFTSLYVTDFLSSLHAMNLTEDISVTLAIFVKIPLLLLVYTYRSQLSRNNGENLINQV